MPIAVAIGAFGIINGGNQDFVVLRHSPAVVASLIVLVAACAPAMALADGWLDRRLPKTVSSLSPAGIAYILLTGIGGLFGAIFILGGLGAAGSRPLSITVIAVGLVTIAWWSDRATGMARPSIRLRAAAGSLLVAGTIFGYAGLLPEVSGALALP